MNKQILLIAFAGSLVLRTIAFGQDEIISFLPEIQTQGVVIGQAEPWRHDLVAWDELEMGPAAEDVLVEDLKTEKVCPASCCCPKCRRCVYAFADALFISRNTNINDQVLVFNTVTTATVLTTGDLQFSSNSGFRAMAGIELSKCQCTALEFEYLGLNDITARAGAVGVNNLAIPGALGLASLDFFNADQITVDYSSNLNSGEMNYVRSCVGDRCWTRSCFAGFRFLSLDEEFNIRAGDPNTATSNYNIKTDNDLYGAQVGGRLKKYCRNLGFIATAKAGLFANDAQQQQFVTDFPPPAFFLRNPIGASDANLAFVGELSLISSIRLTEVWSVRAGYNMLWIDGVALGMSQFDFSNTPFSGTGIDANGSLFLHGASVGLSANF